ncbi:hypothetical protein Tco_1283775 [Tanacetum coccineum]
MLHSSFDMKNMRVADVILGIRIQKNSNGYICTESHYTEKKLKKFGYYDDRSVVTSFDPKVHLKKNKEQRYCDANWISNHNKGKSTSVYVFTLEGADVSLKFSKQTVNTRSTMVAKFVALDKAVEEAEWLRYLLEVEGMGIFKLYLKHLTVDMSFEPLVLKIRVEEDNKMNEKADAKSIEPNVNMVGESSSKSKSNHKNNGKNDGGSRQDYSKDGKKDYTQQKNNNFKKVYHC